jgi:hypothetical protein
VLEIQFWKFPIWILARPLNAPEGCASVGRRIITIIHASTVVREADELKMKYLI